MDLAIFRKVATSNIKFSKKWPLQIQGQFLIQLSELLEEGFSLNEAVQFMELLFDKQKADIHQLGQGLAEGSSLEESLHPFGFGQMVCSQLYLSQKHGSLMATLETSGKLLLLKRKQAKSLQQVMVYPLFLMVFITGMLIAMRSILLPQVQSMLSPEILESNTFAAGIIFLFQNLPMILLVGLSTMLALLLLLFVSFKQKSQLERIRLGLKFPLIKKWLLLYFSFVYSRECAFFLGNGQTLHQMMQQMQETGTSPLTKEIAEFLQAKLMLGQSFSQAMKDIGVFKQEMVWIIIQGELTSQLPIKLAHYAQGCLKDLIADIEKKISIIQPLMFIFIGLSIVAIYAVLLLPTLTILEGK